MNGDGTLKAEISLRVALVGASGYTGAELARLLAGHPQARVACATASGERVGLALSEMFPSLRGVCDILLEAFDPDAIAAKADVAFIALGHGKAMDIAPLLLERGLKVIDLGADFRLRDGAVFEKWYKHAPAPAQVLAQAVYGLPEWNREAIKGARLIANPGCYPTSAILALAPFVQAGLVDARDLVVDSASGVSGAGRSSFSVDYHFPELEGDFKAYGVGTHRHTPEIEQGLRDASGLGEDEVRVTFTPHLLPVSRGILSTCYANLKGAMSTAQALQVLAERYADEPFVRVLPEGSLPTIKGANGSNFCDIGAVVSAHTQKLIVVAAEDNLVKGASGQAIQNMNLMHGFDEREGLRSAALFP
jgi:N-acetyl-gamma-glutamyl-phosphate reductase